MKFYTHPNGFVYVKMYGQPDRSMKVRSLTEAKALAKAARLPEIERAAMANALKGDVLSGYLQEQKVNGAKALEQWEEWTRTVGLAASTVHNYKLQIVRFLTENDFLDRPLIHVKDKHVSDYVNAEDGTKANTRGLRCSAMSNFFAVCTRYGYTVGNPAALVRVNTKKMTFAQKEPASKIPFTDAELTRLNQVCSDSIFWTLSVYLGQHYGLRLSDCCTVQWPQLHGDDFIVWMEKSQRRLALTSTERLHQLWRMVPEVDKTYLFPEEAAIIRDPRRRSKLSVYFGRLLVSAGISGKSFHNLRHTFASRHAALGDPIDEIRIRLGHRFADTTELYVHPHPVE